MRSAAPVLLGLRRHTVQLRPHDPRWIAAGQRLVDALCDLAYVEHVGSTAVPGLHARPIVDLVMARGADFDPLRAALVGRGFLYRGEGAGSIGHLFLQESAPEVRTVHLHVVAHRSAHWRDYVRFRDALLRDGALREAYSALKQELAARHAGDRARYTAEKTGFIQAALRAG